MSEEVLTEPAPPAERPSARDRLVAFVASAATRGDVLELTAGEAKELLEPELVTLEELERRHVLDVLRFLGGNKSQASRVLGIDRRTLYRKLGAWNRGE